MLELQGAMTPDACVPLPSKTDYPYMFVSLNLTFQNLPCQTLQGTQTPDTVSHVQVRLTITM